MLLARVLPHIKSVLKPLYKLSECTAHYSNPCVTWKTRHHCSEPDSTNLSVCRRLFCVQVLCICHLNADTFEPQTVCENDKEEVRKSESTTLRLT